MLFCLLKPNIMNLSLKPSLLLIVILLAANFTFISCKDENNDPAETSTPLMASRLNYSQDGQIHQTDAFHYDSKGRLIELDTSDKYKTTFEYSESQVIMKDYYKDSLDVTQIFKLNNKGLCTSTSWDESYTTDYTYDGNGYRMTSVDKDGNSTITQTYTVSNQNYVTIASQDVYVSSQSGKVIKPDFFGKLGRLKTDPTGIASQNILKSASDIINNYVTDFEFYTDKKNTIDFENMGISFLGRQNKNPVKQQTETYTNMPAHTINFTYEYDSKGRITKQIWEHGGYDVFTYVE